MSKKTLEAHEFSLKDVFCDEYEFEIPRYQRPYSWGEEQAETLVDDLLQFLEEQPDNILDADPYFLGSIVLIKEDKIAKSQVVDGQQRLTTLSLVLIKLLQMGKKYDSELVGWITGKIAGQSGFEREFWMNHANWGHVLQMQHRRMSCR